MMDNGASLRDRAFAASIPSAREMRMQWATDQGAVVFTYPSDLTIADVADVRDLVELALTGMERRAQGIAARSDTTGTGVAVGKSLVPAGNAPEHTPNPSGSIAEQKDATK